MGLVKAIKSDGDSANVETIAIGLVQLLPKLCWLAQHGMDSSEFRGLTVTKKSSQEVLLTLRVTHYERNADGLKDMNGDESGNFVVFMGGPSFPTALAKLEDALQSGDVVMREDRLDPLKKSKPKKRVLNAD